jgi:hypothetical protein
LPLDPASGTLATSSEVRRDGMDEFIAKANIEHFKELLATEKVEAKRKLLLELLAEEELKLAAAVKRKRDREKRD